MPVYATHGDPTFERVVHLDTLFQQESHMSRRQLALALVTIASLALSACGTSPTAPRSDNVPTTVPAIVVSGSTG